MAYWGRVAKRAWKDAREGANLATFEKMAILVFTQFLIGLLIYILLGETALHDQIWTRLATAAAPFGLLPILFLLRLPMTPPKLDREWEEWKAENEVKDKSGRWGLLYQIANLWRAETNDKSVAMQQGLGCVDKRL